MNKNEIYEKNLKGLQTFSQLSLEERLEILAKIGILTKDDHGYRLAEEYGGESNKESKYENLLSHIKNVIGYGWDDASGEEIQSYLRWAIKG